MQVQLTRLDGMVFKQHLHSDPLGYGYKYLSALVWKIFLHRFNEELCSRHREKMLDLAMASKWCDVKKPSPNNKCISSFIPVYFTLSLIYQLFM
jgi:hypothetical protein